MLDEKSLKRSLELIEKQMIRDAYHRRNIDAFTELFMAVIKAFIDQACSERSYMPTHAKFDWWDENDEKQGEIKWIECIITSPNGFSYIFNFSAQTNPRWLYDHVYYLIETHELKGCEPI